jgi:hypothetical protein
VKINCAVRLLDFPPPPSVPSLPPSTPMSCHYRLPQCRLPRCHAVASLNADAAPSPPPSVQPPSTPRCHLPQCRCRAAAASLDAAPSPPSTSTPRCRCLPRCNRPRCHTVTSLNTNAAPSPSPSTLCHHLPQLLILSTLFYSVQSAGIVLGVIALFVGLISSIMICGVVRLERDSLRVLVS